MKKILWLTPIIFIGCVSTSKYKKLETDSKAEQMALTEKNQALEKELTELKSTNAALSQQNEQTRNQYASVYMQLQNEVHEGNLKVTEYQNMLTVDVAEKLFFDSGSAVLKKSGEEVLSKVGKALAQYTDKAIRVVGHTDNVPVSKSRQNGSSSNWELSVLRATTVVRYLQEKCQLNPLNLIASGRGEYHPLAPNDTPEGRQKNRRIEIMLVDKAMADAIRRQANEQNK